MKAWEKGRGAWWRARAELLPAAAWSGKAPRGRSLGRDAPVGAPRTAGRGRVRPARRASPGLRQAGPVGGAPAEGLVGLVRLVRLVRRED